MILANNLETRRHAAQIISEGGVIAFRTDTLYGLAVDPFNSLAVKRLKELKGRQESKPILLLISEIEIVNRLIPKTSRTFDVLAQQFWPGPLTLVGTGSTDLPNEITAGTNTVGVRFPNDSNVQELVRHCGGALTATSANPANSKPAETADEVEAYFKTGLEFVIDGGRVTTTQASTVVDTTTVPAVIIREGEVSRTMIENVLRQVR
jgi:L-threonylcarbamoyladenylate synthase